jgi:hypothetical protein
VGALMTFQTVGLPLLFLLVVVTIVAIARQALTRRAGIGWMLLWLIAAYAIAKPSITMSIAHLLGIGRGADLVFYCGILGMLIGFFLIYIRIKRLEQENTVLVRHIALAENERETR